MYNFEQIKHGALQDVYQVKLNYIITDIYNKWAISKRVSNLLLGYQNVRE